MMRHFALILAGHQRILYNYNSNVSEKTEQSEYQPELVLSGLGV